MEGVLVLRVYEGSRGLVQPISMGKVTVSRLLDTMRAILQAESLKEFMKSLRVGGKAFIAQHGSNCFASFVAVVEHGGGSSGRRGFAVFLK
jgi:hypothetical protein